MSESGTSVEAEDWIFLKISAGTKPLWLCVVNPELRTYAYISDSGRFHLNKGIYVDYVWDQELTYVPVSLEEARVLVDAELGKLPQELSQYRRQAYLTSESLDARDVFRHVEATVQGGYSTQAQQETGDATGTKPAQLDSEAPATASVSGLDRSEIAEATRETTPPEERENST